MGPQSTTLWFNESKDQKSWDPVGMQSQRLKYWCNKSTCLQWECSLQAYESKTIVTCYLRINKSITVIDVHCFFTDIRRIPRTHVGMVMVQVCCYFGSRRKHCRYDYHPFAWNLTIKPKLWEEIITQKVIKVGDSKGVNHSTFLPPSRM